MENIQRGNLRDLSSLRDVNQPRESSNRLTWDRRVFDTPRVKVVLERNTVFNELSAEDHREISKILKETVVRGSYDSFKHYVTFFSSFERALQESPQNLDMLRFFTDEFSIRSGDDLNDQCIGLSNVSIRILNEINIHSYMIPFKSGGALVKDADEYMLVGHGAVIVPSIEMGRKFFTLVDPGLLISKTITFEDGQNSNIVQVGNVSYQVIFNGNSSGASSLEGSEVSSTESMFPYSLVKTKPKRGDAGFDTEVMPFNPYLMVRNPDEAISKDSIRCKGQGKITVQDSEGGVRVALVVTILNKTIRLLIYDKEVIKKTAQGSQEISFQDFVNIKEDEIMWNIFEIFARALRKDPEELYRQIILVIRNTDRYIDELLPQNIRETSKKMIQDKEEKSKKERKS